MRKTTSLLQRAKRYFESWILKLFRRTISTGSDIEQMQNMLDVLKTKDFKKVKITYVGNFIKVLDQNVVDMISLLMAINTGIEAGDSIVILYRESKVVTVNTKDFFTDGNNSHVDVRLSASAMIDEIQRFIDLQKTTNLGEGAQRSNARLINQLNKQLIEVLHSFVELTHLSPVKG